MHFFHYTQKTEKYRYIINILLEYHYFRKTNILYVRVKKSNETDKIKQNKNN